jgi:hypothetical protein
VRRATAHSHDWLYHMAMENELRNLTIGTLIRVAHVLDSPSKLPSFLRANRVNPSGLRAGGVEIKLVRRKKGVVRDGGGEFKSCGVCIEDCGARQTTSKSKAPPSKTEG